MIAVSSLEHRGCSRIGCEQIIFLKMKNLLALRLTFFLLFARVQSWISNKFPKSVFPTTQPRTAKFDSISSSYFFYKKSPRAIKRVYQTVCIHLRGHAEECGRVYGNTVPASGNHSISRPCFSTFAVVAFLTSRVFANSVAFTLSSFPITSCFLSILAPLPVSYLQIPTMRTRSIEYAKEYVTYER